MTFKTIDSIKLPDNPRILCMGDSLTKGWNMPDGHDYPSRLAVMSGLEVINSGVAGETSAQGLDRLPQMLAEHKPDIVIFQYGGNDMLRNVMDRVLGMNLRNMLQLSVDAGAVPLFFAIPRHDAVLTPNFIYKEIADEKDVLVDLEAVREIMFQDELKMDFFHPNSEGYFKLAEFANKLVRTAKRIHK
mgnify:CR=1 FL=1